MSQVAHQTTTSRILSFRSDGETHLGCVPDERGHDSFGTLRAAWDLGNLGKIEGCEVVHEAVVDRATRVQASLKRSVYFASGAATESLTLRVQSSRTLRERYCKRPNTRSRAAPTYASFRRCSAQHRSDYREGSMPAGMCRKPQSAPDGQIVQRLTKMKAKMLNTLGKTRVRYAQDARRGHRDTSSKHLMSGTECADATSTICHVPVLMLYMMSVSRTESVLRRGLI